MIDLTVSLKNRGNSILLLASEQVSNYKKKDVCPSAHSFS